MSPTTHINTDVMKEDKCYPRRLPVDRVSKLVPISVWIIRTLQRCIALQVATLSDSSPLTYDYYLMVESK